MRVYRSLRSILVNHTHHQLPWRHECPQRSPQQWSRESPIQIASFTPPLSSSRHISRRMMSTSAGSDHEVLDAKATTQSSSSTSSSTSANITSPSPPSSLVAFPPQPLALPETTLPSDRPQKTAQLSLNGDGDGIKLDHLGPMVVNVDGTLSRVANWHQMAEIERENTLRVLGRRNRARLAALGRKQGGGEEERV